MAWSSDNDVDLDYHVRRSGLAEPGRVCELLVPGLAKATSPAFNVCISNVPGAREPLYFNGARLVGNYPMSLVLDGQALNITLTRSSDSLDFGLVGCRRSVPHLQRVLSHPETSLKELERAVGL